MAQWGWLQKNGVGVMKMRTDRKGVCPWCLEQMVRLCLCAFWGHPLGIGALFEHSFRGPRQISELCSSPPSGPGQQLTSAHACVYYRNCHWGVSFQSNSFYSWKEDGLRTDAQTSFKALLPHCHLICRISECFFLNISSLSCSSRNHQPPSVMFRPSSWLNLI